MWREARDDELDRARADLVRWLGRWVDRYQLSLAEFTLLLADELREQLQHQAESQRRRNRRRRGNA